MSAYSDAIEMQRLGFYLHKNESLFDLFDVWIEAYPEFSEPTEWIELF